MTMRMGGEWNMENAVPAAVTGDGQDADELFRSLGSDYSCIFRVDLSKNRVESLRLSDRGQQTLNQVNRMRSLGCDYIQGYYYSKPVPVEEFEHYMTSYAARSAQ